MLQFISKQDEQRIKQQKKKSAEDKLKKEMVITRKKQLKQANEEEDRNIKFLEKQLKLNKRKAKNIPASFKEDGLDYLLEVCDSDNIKSVVSAEQHLSEINNEFEEDFELMTSKTENSARNEKSDDEDVLEYDFQQSKLNQDDDEFDLCKDDGHSDLYQDESNLESDTDCSDLDTKSSLTLKKRKLNDKSNKGAEKRPKTKVEDDSLDDEDVDEQDEDFLEKEAVSEEWEDIYGRIRNADGSIKIVSKNSILMLKATYLKQNIL